MAYDKASFRVIWAGESSASIDGTMESIGIPDQYGVAVGVS